MTILFCYFAPQGRLTAGDCYAIGVRVLSRIVVARRLVHSLLRRLALSASHRENNIQLFPLAHRFGRIKKRIVLLSAFLAEKWRVQNIGRELAFSADLCYNGGSVKPPSEREGDRVSGGRSLRNFEFGLISL